MPSNRYSLVRGRPPLMRGSCEFGRQRDARRERRERDEGAAVQRQLHDLLVLDDGAEAGASPRGAIGASAVTVTCSLHVADGEVEVDARLLAGRQADAFAPHRLEARPARRRRGTRPAPGSARCRRRRRSTATTRCRFVSTLVTVTVAPGDRRAGLILHDAGDFTGGHLGEKR